MRTSPVTLVYWNLNTEAITEIHIISMSKKKSPKKLIYAFHLNKRDENSHPQKQFTAS